MNRTKNTIILILLGILLFITIFFYGRYLGKRAESTKTPISIINSQTILERITDQYFLVTKTVFINSQAEIETPKNNNWTDLFTGKKMSISGLVRIDVGLEMGKMKPEDINIDYGRQTVTVSLPQAEILNTSLSGDLNIDEDKAVVEKLKDLFKNTQEADYNLAMQTIISNAKSQVIADETIFNEARADSVKLVELIISSMLKDYKLIIR